MTSERSFKSLSPYRADFIIKVRRGLIHTRSCMPGLLGEKGIFLDHTATRSRNPVDRLVKRCLKENGSLERGISGFLWAPRANLNVKRFLNMSLMSHQFSNWTAYYYYVGFFLSLHFGCEKVIVGALRRLLLAQFQPFSTIYVPLICYRQQLLKFV